MVTTLTPEKLGEALIAQSFQVLHKAGKLADLDCFAVNAKEKTNEKTTLGVYLSQAGVEPSGLFRSLVCPLPLKDGPLACLFNTEHNLDVLIDGAVRCMPVEVKLGETITPGRFRDQFDGEVTYEASNRQMKGSMISIFEGRFDAAAFQGIAEEKERPPAAPLRVKLTDGTTKELTSDWLLVLRRVVWNRQRSRFSVLKRAKVVLFEDLAQSVRNTLGSDAEFDKLVLGLVGSGFAKAWGI